MKLNCYMKIIKGYNPVGVTKHELVVPILFFLVLIFENILRIYMKSLTEHKIKRRQKRT